VCEGWAFSAYVQGGPLWCVCACVYVCVCVCVQGSLASGRSLLLCRQCTPLRRCWRPPGTGCRDGCAVRSARVHAAGSVPGSHGALHCCRVAAPGLAPAGTWHMPRQTGHMAQASYGCGHHLAMSVLCLWASPGCGPMPLNALLVIKSLAALHAAAQQFCGPAERSRRVVLLSPVCRSAGMAACSVAYMGAHTNTHAYTRDRTCAPVLSYTQLCMVGRPAHTVNTLSCASPCFIRT